MLKITLAAARVNVGLSQKEAAKRLGISNKTLCKWETGAAFPRADLIDKICELYRVGYDHLIFLPHSSL